MPDTLYKIDKLEDLTPGEVDSEIFSGNAILFVYDHTHSHMGIPFSEDSAPVIIAFIAPVGQNILGMVHPPIKDTGWSQITSSTVNDFPAAAMAIAPIGLPMGIETDSFPGSSAVRGSVSTHSITGHVLSVIPGS